MFINVIYCIFGVLCISKKNVFNKQLKLMKIFQKWRNKNNIASECYSNFKYI